MTCAHNRQSASAAAGSWKFGACSDTPAAPGRGYACADPSGLDMLPPDYNLFG